MTRFYDIAKKFPCYSLQSSPSVVRRHYLWKLLNWQHLDSLPREVKRCSQIFKTILWI